MPRYPRRAPAPWLRSTHESLPPERDPARHVRPTEVLIVLAVIVAVVAMAIWFLFMASGGLGQGSV